MEAIGLDIQNRVFGLEESINAAKNNSHKEALQKAMEAFDKGDNGETFIGLADYYSQQGDEINYIKALEAVPKNSSSFQEANETLFNHIIQKPYSDNESKKIESLKKLIEYAANAGGHEKEVDHLFNELCGAPYSSQPEITGVANNPLQALLKMADIRRNEGKKSLSSKLSNTMWQHPHSTEEQSKPQKEQEQKQEPKR